MNLNKRVPVIILPVLLSIFILLSAGLYAAERRSVYSHYRNKAEVEASELAGVFQQYRFLTKSLLGVLMQSDLFRDYLRSANGQQASLLLSKYLNSVFEGQIYQTLDQFTLVALKNSGEVKYSYKNQLDDKTVIKPYLKVWLEQLEVNNEFSASYFFNNENEMVFCRIVDEETLLPLQDFRKESALILFSTVRLSQLMEQRQDLSTKNWVVAVNDQAGKMPLQRTFEARRDVPDIGILSVAIDEKVVQRKLSRIFFQLLFGSMILILISHFTLQRLLHKYVTGPIERLEKTLADVDLHATQEIEIYQSQDEIGNLSKTFAALYDQLRETYQGTKELAERDSLTTLYNRRVFNLILEKLITRAEKNHEKVALLYIDIDNFKYVNDQYGHATGDALLRNFAFRLHEVVRGGDIVHCGLELESTAARIAGDEFAIIIHGFTDSKVPGNVARRILSLCDNGFSFEEAVYPISLSIGVASYPDDAQTTNDLIVNADTAMYQSKKTGKNRISFFAEGLAESSKRQQAVEASLKHLDYKEFELYYMPIIETSSRAVYAFEALLRWTSKNLGPVSPAEFIPLAESIGIYQEIDLWVLERAFHDSKVIQSVFGERVRVSINISAAELSQKDFVDKIFPLLEKHAVHPLSFTLEITETFYQDHSESGQHLMKTLNQSGFQLAIDDLGSGYTSLLQLVEFPINIVKLDRTFVVKSLASENQKTLHALVEFCHAQGLHVIAEGVESAEEAEILAQNGCDYLQGFHFSKPISLSDLLVADLVIKA